MQFIRRGPDERHPDNVDDADVVVQIGAAKTGLKAAHLMGAHIRISRSPGFEALEPSHTFPKATNTQDKALEALSQMQNALSPEEQQLSHEPCAPWSPYSPDDAYPYRPQPNSTADSVTLPWLHREPSDATLPAYYDPGHHPYYISQQTSASAVRDMALHKGAPTIFDNLVEPSPRLRFSDAPEVVEDSLPQQGEVRRFSIRAKTRSRTLSLVNPSTQPKSSSPRWGPRSRLSRVPSTMADFARPPSMDQQKLRKSRMTASPVGVAMHSYGAARASNRASRPFDEAVLDQHKTNVRRPPKGIKNWFDAYDVDDDDDDDLVDEVDKPEPQELPADDVLPPVYTGPYRHMSRASDKSTSGQLTLHDSHHAPQQGFERAMEHGRLNRSSNSSRSDSIQSSHIGSVYQSSHNRRVASTLGQESVLTGSGSGSEYEGEEEDEFEEEDYEIDADDEYEDENSRVRSKLPAIRDSIFDDRNIMVANASALGVVRLPKPTQLNSIRVYHQVASSRSSFRSSTSAPSTQQREKPLPLPPHHEQPPSSPIASDSAALRRLNGLSLESSCTTETTETSNTGHTAETRSSGTSYDDTANESPQQDGLHMVAITEEERMLLEIMRQKRVAMQQMSFTEGYQLALRTEQQRLAKRSANAEERALKHLQEEETSQQYRMSDASASAQTPTQESEMRRQLSAIRKEQVDERFQMERFLDMSAPAPLASHPPDASQGERKPRAPSGEVLPATRYSPAAYSLPAVTTTTTENPGYLSGDEYDAESVRKRVKQFISSKGAPPPLDSNMRTMRRPVPRHYTSMSPSPVIEEDRPDTPPLPPRSPQRANGHMREFSNFTVSSLGLRRSSSSICDDSKDRSPVSAFSGHHSTHQIDSPDLTPQQQIPHHDMVLLPPRPDLPVRTDSKLRKSPSQPQLGMNHSSRVSINAASPFANLINAASRVSVQHQPMSHIASQYHNNNPRTASSTDLRVSSHHGGVQKIDIVKSSGTGTTMGKQPILPRLDTMEHMRDSRASMVSITSAGEEVLSAWAELGGGQDCLQTKVRHRTPSMGQARD